MYFLMKYYFLLLLVNTSFGIGIDYLEYESKDEIQNETTTTEDQFHRVGLFKYRKSSTTTTSTTTSTPDLYLDDKDDEDDDSGITFQTGKVTLNVSCSVSTKDYLRHIITEKTTISKTTKSHVFLEYEYYPDGAEYPDSDKAAEINIFDDVNIEEEHIEEDHTEVLRRTLPTTTNFNEETERNVFDLSSNYEPAASFNYFSEYSTDVRNVNTWYVPEKYPCWDLPILFGKLGRKKVVDNVFLISPTMLKVVVDPDNDHVPIFSEVTRKFDKWCSSAPCYGDHTLCLFPSRFISRICEPSYRVESPTKTEQISLVNTINSMRNHVAKGTKDQYPYLPSAMNMKQMLYDYDLERMAKAWLRQCLPGPAPCSSLDENYVRQLECTKYAEQCCIQSLTYRKYVKNEKKCTPKAECFIPAIIGCIYTWFWSAGPYINEMDITCGNIKAHTYATIQLLWANTLKVGCAYGVRSTGDIRVVCNFNPGALFELKIKYYCGLLVHNDVTSLVNVSDIMDDDFLLALGINITPNPTTGPRVHSFNYTVESTTRMHTRQWGMLSLFKNYKEGTGRFKMNDSSNGTKGFCARLVTRYKFHQDEKEKCDSNAPVYAIGEPGAECMETGSKFFALCYDFRDPTPGYRAMAVIAPVALFSLILYDLFSGVMKHVNS